MPRIQQVSVLPDGIKAWRGERKMSQMDLARAAGCSEGLIAQIETGRRQPGLENAVAIADALGVKLSAFAVIHVTAETLNGAIAGDAA